MNNTNLAVNILLARGIGCILCLSWVSCVLNKMGHEWQGDTYSFIIFPVAEIGSLLQVYGNRKLVYIVSSRNRKEQKPIYCLVCIEL